LTVSAFHPAIAEDKSTITEHGQIERGRYLVEIGGCNDRHAAGYTQAEGRIEESKWLIGSNLGGEGFGAPPTREIYVCS
jgi:hypothetical protein